MGALKDHLHLAQNTSKFFSLERSVTLLGFKVKGLPPWRLHWAPRALRCAHGLALGGRRQSVSGLFQTGTTWREVVQQLWIATGKKLGPSEKTVDWRQSERDLNKVAGWYF